jgi:ABC-type antimicrobial peptide transport system permease subunit
VARSLALTVYVRRASGNKDVAVTLVPLREVIGGDVRVPLYVLTAVVGVFLLIACFNVASMLLARSAARTREMAIRAALGAGRGAIVRQLLVESLLLALSGGLGGIVIAYVAANAAMHSDMAQVADVSVDRGVLLFALGLSVVTSGGGGGGLIPSLTITRRSAYACLRGDAMPRGGRSRHVLVILIPIESRAGHQTIFLCGFRELCVDRRGIGRCHARRRCVQASGKVK